MVLLGGSWDLVTGYNPTYNWGNSYKAIEGGYKQGYKPSYK